MVSEIKAVKHMESSMLDRFSETTDNSLIQKMLEAFKEVVNSEEEEQTARLAQELLIILQERQNEANED